MDSRATAPTAQAPPSTGGQSVLDPMNRTGLNRFHAKTILIAGMGFFTDAYDLFVIGLIAALFVFYKPFAIPGSLFSLPFGGSAGVISGIALISAAAIFGAVIGPMVFGNLGDRFGRKTVYGIEMLVLVIGALASGLAWSFASLVAFRLIVGVGVGGDYPMSSTIMSEYSNVRDRGKLVGTVFAMQGFGLLAGVALGVGLLLWIPNSPDLIWRILLMAGAVPAAAVYYFRRRLPETPRYTLFVEGQTAKTAKTVRAVTGVTVASGVASVGKTQRNGATFLSKYWPLVLGTAFAWFLFDISFYGTSIYTPTLISSLSLAYAPHLTAIQHLTTAEEYTALITVIFTIPGYWIAVALIDRVGRRTLQIVGFGFMALAFAVLGFVPSLVALGAPFVAIYGLTFLFGNMGPNTTTFVVPTEVFPTQYRTTGHGIAAGAGKTGAAIGTLFFAALVAIWSPSGMMLFLALIALAGVIVTFVLIPETKQLSLEVSSKQEEFQQELAAPAATAPTVPSE
ncbi:MAG: MFS transporter [Candidatus Thermoplasmatota archaeon]|nr:MFS transporter [Candidatus Thermoplasmatota archaeon]